MDEVSAPVDPLTTADDVDPVGLALVDVAQDAVELLLADQRADHDAFFFGATQLQVVAHHGDAVDDLLVDAALGEDA